MIDFTYDKPFCEGLEPTIEELKARNQRLVMALMDEVEGRKIAEAKLSKLQQYYECD